jgi:hypothetical protein
VALPGNSIPWTPRAARNLHTVQISGRNPVKKLGPRVGQSFAHRANLWPKNPVKGLEPLAGSGVAPQLVIKRTRDAVPWPCQGIVFPGPPGRPEFAHRANLWPEPGQKIGSQGGPEFCTPCKPLAQRNPVKGLEPLAGSGVAPQHW